MALQSLDIKRMSATTVQPPVVREPVTGTVAKLIDVSKCIGCKACQTACMEWNDLRDVDGMKAPFKIAVRQGGQKFADVIVEEIKVNTGATEEQLSKRP